MEKVGQEGRKPNRCVISKLCRRQPSPEPMGNLVHNVCLRIFLPQGMVATLILPVSGLPLVGGGCKLQDISVCMRGAGKGFLVAEGGSPKRALMLPFLLGNEDTNPS